MKKIEAFGQLAIEGSFNLDLHREFFEKVRNGQDLTAYGLIYFAEPTGRGWPVGPPGSGPKLTRKPPGGGCLREIVALCLIAGGIIGTLSTGNPWWLLLILAGGVVEFTIKP